MVKGCVIAVSNLSNRWSFLFGQKSTIFIANLEEDVDEIENLAKDELVNVGVVRPEGPQDILDDSLSAGFVLVHAVEDVLIVQVLDEHAELSTWKQMTDEPCMLLSCVMFLMLMLNKAFAD